MPQQWKLIALYLAHNVGADVKSGKVFFYGPFIFQLLFILFFLHF